MYTHICYTTDTNIHTHTHILKPHKFLYGDNTVIAPQQPEIESPIYCGALGPELLTRANLNEHPACIIGFTLHKYYITTEPIH